MVATRVVGDCRFNRCFLLIGIVIAITASASIAGADPGPREFYGKDFASAPRVSNAPLQGEEVHKSSQSAKAADAEQRNEKDLDGIKEPVAADDAEQKVIAAMQAQGGLGQRKQRDGSSATTLLLFVSSLDKQHVRSVLKKAIEVVKKDEAFLTTVFHIGDYRNIPEELAATLDLYGVAVVPMPAPPEDLGFTQSPAWVFQNKEGVQIVEGAVDIEQFHDGDGNFKEPENFIVKQAPAEPSELKK